MSTPMKSELYTSLVISARPIATTGGKSDQKLPAILSPAVTPATTKSPIITTAAIARVIFFAVDIVFSFLFNKKCAAESRAKLHLANLIALRKATVCTMLSHTPALSDGKLRQASAIRPFLRASFQAVFALLLRDRASIFLLYFVLIGRVYHNIDIKSRGFRNLIRFCCFLVIPILKATQVRLSKYATAREARNPQRSGFLFQSLICYPVR